MTSLESYFQAGDPNSWALIVDTSSKNGGLHAVNKKLESLYTTSWGKDQKHTDVLLEKFKNLKAKLPLNKMVLICFVNGPGSFTGLRIGASFVKALSYSTQKTPLITISSFWPIAFKVSKENPSLKQFSVCLPSIGSKFFRADFEQKIDKSYHETINFNGAQTDLIYKEHNFSPDKALCDKHADIKHIEVPEENLTESLRRLDKQDAHIKRFSYLDLYPLYLRKSEAEEKYSYDKIKL